MVQAHEHMQTPVEAATSPGAPRLVSSHLGRHRRQVAQAAIEYMAVLAAWATSAAAYILVMTVTLIVGFVQGWPGYYSACKQHPGLISLCLTWAPDGSSML